MDTYQGKRTGRRGKVYRVEYGEYEITWNTAAWSHCTANQEHYPSQGFEKGWRDEADLPPCHCGAPQRFGYPVSVVKVLSTTKFDGELEHRLGVGGFRHVNHVERRSFRLKRQQMAHVERLREKYRKKAAAKH